MKNKLYASLFVWIGLTVVATPSLAKPSAPAARKPTTGATKADKSNSHAATSNKVAPAKQQASDKSHAIEKHDTKVADSKNKSDKTDKHDKKNQQVADSKDSKNKHDKKSHQLADAKDHKHDKHGKKDQQLVDADDKKHHRKKSQHAGNDSNQEENDSEDSSTAVYEDEAQSENADSNVAQEHTNDLAPVTAKSSPLFFQPLDKSAAPVFAETKPNDKVVAPATEQADTNPFAASPTSANFRVHTTLGDSTMVNANNRVHSSLTGNKSSSFISAENHETQAHVKSTHGVIDGSLDEAGTKAGLSNDMIIELADVFAWDIDFANNIQTGDQFTVIYEDGAGNAGNRIVAAQFVNRGKTYTAIRYKDKEGMTSYYSPDGRSLRKAFLSTPIDFAQVSSHFDPHRMHPILNRIRAHKGVDYAARIGTPVKAAGDGVVTFHGNKGGYGRMIVLAHGEHYETAYAHLSDFRQDLQDGEPVKQGDVIGYVGQSGLATGPHLHYEFRIDGEHHDPEKLDSKQAMRLPNGIWEDFHSQTVPILTQLNQAKSGTLVAKNP